MTRLGAFALTVTDGDHRKVRVRFPYAGESDRVRYHCRLYETWATRVRDGTIDHAIRFTADEFVAVDTSGLQVDPDSAAVN